MAEADQGLPSGLVTFVVTDIQGSTRLLRQDNDGYAITLARHHDILAEAWADYGGHVVDQIGDGSLAVFADASDAVHACASAQRSLALAPWPVEAPLVRIGLHSGFANISSTGYVSITLHQAHRVGQAANGGQVLVSESTAAQVDSALLQPLGRYRLRDFDHPVQLFTMADDRDPAPPRCTPAGHHNLRPSPTALIGRLGDIAALDSLLRAQRVVSVLGSAGVGKSRLAREWGLRHADRWDSGVWLMDCSLLGTWQPDDAEGELASSRGVQQLLQALMASLGLRPNSAPDGVQVLADHLQDRGCVLILDNADRWRAPIAEVLTELLPACPGLRFLVTSTEPLHVGVEAMLRLTPLATHDTDSTAVQLFLQRASTARPGLQIDPAYRAQALQLCRRLDGLPLALEIAAARADLLSPNEIVAALDRGVVLPRLSDPTRPKRHHALSELLAWHTAQLHPQELTALRRLAYFPTSFDLSLAEAAVGFAPLTASDVSDLLWSLIDRSLVLADPEQGARRFRLLQTVRDVVLTWPEGTTQLRAEQAKRLAHTLLRHVGPDAPATRTWVHAVDADLDTLRVVLDTLAPEQAELAQTLACTLARRHAAVQAFRTGVAEIRTLAGRLTEPTPARVGLLTDLGHLYARIGDPQSALRMADLADAIRERTGSPSWDDVGVEKLRGENAIAHDRPEAAVILARSTLRQALSPRGQARMWNLAGAALMIQGQLTESLEAVDAELETAQLSGDDSFRAIALNNSAEILLRLGRIREAARRQRAALELAAVIGQRGVIAFSLMAAAQLTVASAAHRQQAGQGPDPQAVSLMARADSILQETGLSLYDVDARAVEDFALAARRELGSDAYHTLFVEGRAMDDNRAVLIALDLLDEISMSAATFTGGHT